MASALLASSRLFPEAPPQGQPGDLDDHFSTTVQRTILSLGWAPDTRSKSKFMQVPSLPIDATSRSRSIDRDGGQVRKRGLLEASIGGLGEAKAELKKAHDRGRQSMVDAGGFAISLMSGRSDL